MAFYNFHRHLGIYPNCSSTSINILTDSVLNIKRITNMLQSILVSTKKIKPTVIKISVLDKINISDADILNIFDKQYDDYSPIYCWMMKINSPHIIEIINNSNDKQLIISSFFDSENYHMIIFNLFILIIIDAFVKKYKIKERLASYILKKNILNNLKYHHLETNRLDLNMIFTDIISNKLNYWKVV